MIHKSTKTYGHEVGLSACFRQWKADSHCHFIHGYALSVALEFSADTLDDKNWVVDFGGLKEVKAYLVDNFDHKLLVAVTDPRIDDLTLLDELGLAEVRVVNAVGCEAFASQIGTFVGQFIKRESGGRVWLSKVEVREHGANSGIIEYARGDWSFV